MSRIYRISNWKSYISAPILKKKAALSFRQACNLKEIQRFLGLTDYLEISYLVIQVLLNP